MQADDFFASIEARQESEPNGYMAARAKLEARRGAATQPRETEEEIVEHKCPKCGKVCASAQGVKVHNARAHGNSAGATVQAPATAPKVPERPFEPVKPEPIVTTTEPEAFIADSAPVVVSADVVAEDDHRIVAERLERVRALREAEDRLVESLDPVVRGMRQLNRELAHEVSQHLDTIAALVDRIIVLESRRIAPLAERVAHAFEKPALPYELNRGAIIAWAEGKAESRRRLDVIELVRSAPDAALEAVRRLIEGDAA